MNLKNRPMLFYLPFALLGLYLLFGPKRPNLSYDANINLRADFEGDKIILQAKRLSGEPLSQVDVYRNGELFFRAYPSRVSTESASLDKGVVTIVFDDGWLDVFTDAFPLLQRFSYPASIAVIASYIDKPGGLSSRQIKRLVDNGWDVLAHGISDRSLVSLPADEQEKELLQSKAYLWQKFWATQIFVFPFGELDDDLIKLSQKYYWSARGYEDGLNTSPIEPFAIKIKSLEKNTRIEEARGWIDQAESEKSWLVLVSHHVSRDDKGQYTFRPEKLGAVLSYLSTKQVRVATSSQALQELNPNLAAIKNNELSWEFEKKLLGPGPHEIYVVMNGRTSAPIRLH